VPAPNVTLDEKLTKLRLAGDLPGDAGPDDTMA
jgi:hypothetical protein